MKTKLMVIGLLLAIVQGVFGAAGAAGTDGATCQIAGQARFEPTLTTMPRETTVSFTGTLTACQGAAGATSSDIDATGSGVLSCLGGDGFGSATLAWSDSQTSVVSFTATVRTPTIVISGGVDGGTRFVGKQAQALLAGDILSSPLAPASAANCRMSVGGIGSAPFRGVVSIS